MIGSSVYNRLTEDGGVRSPFKQFQRLHDKVLGFCEGKGQQGGQAATRRQREKAETAARNGRI